MRTCVARIAAPRRAGALAGLGLRDIAKAANLSVTAIANLETGSTRRPRISTVQALQTILESHDIEFAPCGWVRHRGDHWPKGTTDSSFIPLPMGRTRIPRDPATPDAGHPGATPHLGHLDTLSCKMLTAKRGLLVPA